jgi:hypothetical protein
MKDFPDYRLLLDEQAEQTFAITDDYGARAQDWRKTLRFISESRNEESIASEDEPISRSVVRPKAYFRGSPR